METKCSYVLQGCGYPNGECIGLCSLARQERDEYLLDEYRSGLDSPPEDYRKEEDD